MIFHRSQRKIDINGLSLNDTVLILYADDTTLFQLSKTSEH